MPVMKKNLQFKKAELVFEDDRVIVIEELKDDVCETDLVEKLKMFERINLEVVDKFTLLHD